MTTEEQRSPNKPEATLVSQSKAGIPGAGALQPRQEVIFSSKLEDRSFYLADLVFAFVDVEYVICITFEVCFLLSCKTTQELGAHERSLIRSRAHCRGSKGLNKRRIFPRLQSLPRG